MKIYVMPLGLFQTNCYIVADEKSKEAVVIDPGECTDGLKALVSGDMISKVKYILLTHGHFDHMCGAYDLKQFTGAKVAVHELDEPNLESKEISRAELNGYEQTCMKADILLHDGDKISFGDVEFDVMHVPGHTVGGVCYIEKSERVIFSGDTLFCHTIGRTDLPGGNMEQMTESLKRICEIEGDYKIYPGHNRDTTLDSERRRNIYMRRFR